VQKRILPIAITAITIISLIGWSCTKLDTTDIGSDLLPAVDNVHTFADTLSIITTQGIFNDTTEVLKTVDFALGAINNDPLFGKTSAAVYLQLKPTFYPYYFGNANDTITGIPGVVGLDSVVLCLSYRTFWGDSTLPIQLDVREVVENEFRDSIYKTHDINYAPVTGALLASTTVDIRRLADTVKYANRRDYSINLIRIKMPMSWANTLYNRDSTSTNSSNNAFALDSIFRHFYNGLAVIPTGSGANAIMYVNLADTSTKLEVHFRKKSKTGVIDTTFQSLSLNARNTPPGTSEPGPSSVANYIVRNRAGASISAPAAGEHYLQATPGSYVNLNIPGLSTLSNRIIHRAEIIIQQIPHNTILDEILSAPPILYLDLKDTTTADNWKPIYYDLNSGEGYDPDSKLGYGYFPTGGIDYFSFGGYRRAGADKFSNPIKYYNFNISRHVQRIVTNHTTNYNFRLYAPYEVFYPQLGNALYPAQKVPIANNLAAGRVKIGGGNNPNYRMILRIVYSNL